MFFAIIAFSQKVNNGRDVIQLMKEKYNNKYMTNFTFSQHILEYENDSLTNKTVWHEAYSYPHRLIIKFDSYDSGKGYVYNNDSLYIMGNNKAETIMPKWNDLILIAFDIYENTVDKTAEMLTEIGYDISKVYETTIDGKVAYCVGAFSEDEKSHKFYVDKEGLYFIKNNKYYESGEWETVFADFETIDGILIATKVLFYHDSSLVMSEDYYDIKFPEKVDNSIYDYQNFEKSEW